MTILFPDHVSRRPPAFPPSTSPPFSLNSCAAVCLKVRAVRTAVFGWPAPRGTSRLLRSSHRLNEPTLIEIPVRSGTKFAVIRILVPPTIGGRT